MSDPVLQCRALRGLQSAMQFDRETVDALFARADHIKRSGNRCTQASLQHRIVALLFFQESTRTRFSFETSVLRLGGKVIGFDSPEGTRSGGAWKESLADMARIIAGYADCVVLRHSDGKCLEEYVAASEIPVINAGTGTGAGSEHPTQALLDVYTLREAFGGIDDLDILLVGNMALRTVASFLKLMRLYPGCKISLFPSNDGEVPAADQRKYSALGIQYQVVSDLDVALRNADIVYHHGVAEGPDAKIDPAIRLDRQRLSELKGNAVLMHSLPRVGELSNDIDCLPQAWYFRQAANGVPVRMALLEHLLGEG